MTEIKEGLEKIKARLQAGWTQGSFARNASGEEVSWCSIEATSYCLIGGIYSVCKQEGLDTNLIFGLIEDEVFPGESPPSLFIFNDHPSTTLEKIVTVIDKAIAKVS